jgi:hypothetical protein
LGHPWTPVSKFTVYGVDPFDKATAIPHIIIDHKQGGDVDTVIGADEMRVRKAVDAAATS